MLAALFSRCRGSSLGLNDLRTGHTAVGFKHLHLAVMWEFLHEAAVVHHVVATI